MTVRSLRLNPGVEPFPGYRLVAPIGEGGWSVVWKATRPDGKPCALKFLDCGHAATPATEIRGLQAIRQVKHPNLLEIDQVWSCAGYLVVAMDLADGSLLDLLDVYLNEMARPIPPEHVCFFLTQTAAALDFLNARQHVIDGQRVAFRHCDVKPGNLLVFGQTVKVADFSLAVQVTAPRWYHRKVGTLHYCGPEIFQGWLSDRTDQYALAVTYYQLRTGDFPFPDTPTAFCPTYVRPAPDLGRVSPAERDVLARALAPVPQDRWPSCAEMMRHLTAGCRAAQRAG